MIRWKLVAKIAGGGFGSILLALAILSTVIGLIGSVTGSGAPRGRN